MRKAPYLPSNILYFYIPILAILAEVAFEMFGSSENVKAFVSEDGAIELLQFFVIALAFLAGAYSLLKMDFKTQHGLFVWLALGTIGAFYIAGEEISWGQWIFFWKTPEAWQVINDQKETNLHNVSSWLDQKPRIVLEIGVIMGGLILPLLLKFKPSLPPIGLKPLLPPSI